MLPASEIRCDRTGEVAEKWHDYIKRVNDDAFVEELKSGSRECVMLVTKTIEDGACVCDIRRDVWTIIVKMLGSRDVELKREVLEAVNQIALSDETTVCSMMSLQPHQFLFNIVSSERDLSIVTTTVEVLGELIRDKRKVCEYLDGVGFVSAALFVLEELIPNSGRARGWNDCTGLRQLIGASFALLSASLAAFHMSEKMVDRATEVVESSFSGVIRCEPALVVKAMYDVSYRQPLVASKCCKNAVSIIFEMCISEERNIYVIENALGLLNNITAVVKELAVWMCTSTSFECMPRPLWTQTAHENFMSLLETLVVSGGEVASEIVEPLCAKCQGIVLYIFGVTDILNFRGKIQAVRVICAIIRLRNTRCESVIIVNGVRKVVEMIFEVIHCCDAVVIGECALALHILLTGHYAEETIGHVRDVWEGIDEAVFEAALDLSPNCLSIIESVRNIVLAGTETLRSI